MPESKLKQMAEKYNGAFGPGAIVFGLGFCRELECVIPATLLDASVLEMPALFSVLEDETTQNSLSLAEMQRALTPHPRGTPAAPRGACP